jgi:methyl-accepting chemotaxis protein PixJ
MYLPVFEQVRASLNRSDLLWVGDCKMAAIATRNHIHNHQHYYLMPLPRTGAVPEWLVQELREMRETEAELESVEILGSDGKPSSPLSGYKMSRGVEGRTAEGYPMCWSEQVFLVHSLPHQRQQETGLRNRLQNATTKLMKLTPPVGRGKLRGVVHTRMPEAKLEEVFIQDNPVLRDREHLFVDHQGTIFAAIQREVVGKTIQQTFPALAPLTTGKRLGTAMDRSTNLLGSVAPFPQQSGGFSPSWSVVLTQDTAIVDNAQRKLLFVDLGATLLTALVVGAIAAFLVNRLSQSLLAATETIQRLGQGEFDARIPVAGSNELTDLGSNINQAAEQIQTLLQQQQTATQRAELLKEITLRMTQSTTLGAALKEAVDDIRQALECDRILIYQFSEEGGSVIEESVAPTFPHVLQVQRLGSWGVEAELERYQQGQIQAISNIYKAGLTEQQIRQFDTLSVKAALVAPIRVKQKLFGLLIAHQCSESRSWQPPEIAFFSQLAAQLGLVCNQMMYLSDAKVAQNQAEGLSQDRQQQATTLQTQFNRLMNDVESATKGNLMVQADPEMGRVADLFNTMMSTFHHLVVQTKTTTAQVHGVISRDEPGLRQIVKNLFQQMKITQQGLKATESLSLKLQSIAEQAQQAATLTQAASNAAENGVIAIDNTTQKMLISRDFTEHAAQKIKHLNDTSQNSGRSIALIHQITLRTNVLAINARKCFKTC